MSSRAVPAALAVGVAILVARDLVVTGGALHGGALIADPRGLLLRVGTLVAGQVLVSVGLLQAARRMSGWSRRAVRIATAALALVWIAYAACASLPAPIAPSWPLDVAAYSARVAVALALVAAGARWRGLVWPALVVITWALATAVAPAAFPSPPNGTRILLTWPFIMDATWSISILWLVSSALCGTLDPGPDAEATARSLRRAAVGSGCAAGATVITAICVSDVGARGLAWVIYYGPHVTACALLASWIAVLGAEPEPLTGRRAYRTAIAIAGLLCALGIQFTRHLVTYDNLWRPEHRWHLALSQQVPIIPQ